MKIKDSHLATLSDACNAAALTLPSRDEYRSAGLTDKRYRWDVLHASHPNGRPYWEFVTDELYPYLDDSHIDTALRHIITPIDNEPVASDPRPDPTTHPEYWTE